MALRLVVLNSYIFWAIPLFFLPVIGGPSVHNGIMIISLGTITLKRRFRHLPFFSLQVRRLLIPFRVKLSWVH